jgi:hypothetical protein
VFVLLPNINHPPDNHSGIKPSIQNNRATHIAVQLQCFNIPGQVTTIQQPLNKTRPNRKKENFSQYCNETNNGYVTKNEKKSVQPPLHQHAPHEGLFWGVIQRVMQGMTDLR